MLQRLSALLQLCADKVAMSHEQQDLLVMCLQQAGSLLSKLADEKQADRPLARMRDVADDTSEEHALQVQYALLQLCMCGVAHAASRDRCLRRSWIQTTRPRRRTFAQFSGWSP